MTYRREEGSWPAATTALLRAGQEWLAAQLGISTSRLRQCANPVRGDSLPIAIACRADIAAARAGFGTPLFDCYRAQLAAAGVLVDRAAQAELRSRALRAGIRSAIALLSAALMPKAQEAVAA